VSRLPNFSLESDCTARALAQFAKPTMNRRGLEPLASDMATEFHSRPAAATVTNLSSLRGFTEVVEGNENPSPGQTGFSRGFHGGFVDESEVSPPSKLITDVDHRDQTSRRISPLYYARTHRERLGIFRINSRQESQSTLISTFRGARSIADRETR
jgi:hypothetical protein